MSIKILPEGEGVEVYGPPVDGDGFLVGFYLARTNGTPYLQVLAEDNSAISQADAIALANILQQFGQHGEFPGEAA